MAKPGRATQMKRSREMAKQDKRKDKEEKRAIKKEQKDLNPDAFNDGEDPDLAGIVPGPQPEKDALEW